MERWRFQKEIAPRYIEHIDRCATYAGKQTELCMNRNQITCLTSTPCWTSLTGGNHLFGSCQYPIFLLSPGVTANFPCNYMQFAVKDCCGLSTTFFSSLCFPLSLLVLSGLAFGAYPFCTFPPQPFGLLIASVTLDLTFSKASQFVGQMEKPNRKSNFIALRETIFLA